MRSTLRNRLLALFLTLFVVVGGGTLYVIEGALARDLLASLDKRLTDQGHAVAGWLSTEGHPAELATRLGAVTGTMTGWGIKDDFRQRVQDVLKPGSAALVLFIKKWTEEKALAALAPLGGEVLKTSLSDEATKEINDALEAD